MEFYPQSLSKFANNSCFNSQRDGILLFSLAAIEAAFRKVSIPNGMEFYTSLLCRGIVRKMFQFPTGWNSTEAH